MNTKSGIGFVPTPLLFAILCANLTIKLHKIRLILCIVTICVILRFFACNLYSMVYNTNCKKHIAKKPNNPLANLYYGEVK